MNLEFHERETIWIKLKMGIEINYQNFVKKTVYFYTTVG
jgi:hypothetical protein